MALYTTPWFQIWYSGDPAEKLAQARCLRQQIGSELLAAPIFCAELALLQTLCESLAAQMRAMGLGVLCSDCATRDGGGCCSASMADNTDSLQILINLLLGVEVSLREPADAECCFLGPTGCPFVAKPIFCLNYNCTHIRTGSEPVALMLLEHRAATVLSQQTRIESLLLDRLRCFVRSAPKK